LRRLYLRIYPSVNSPYGPVSLWSHLKFTKNCMGFYQRPLIWAPHKTPKKGVAIKPGFWARPSSIIEGSHLSGLRNLTVGGKNPSFSRGI